MEIEVVVVLETKGAFGDRNDPRARPSFQCKLARRKWLNDCCSAFQVLVPKRNRFAQDALTKLSAYTERKVFSPIHRDLIFVARAQVLEGLSAPLRGLAR